LGALALAGVLEGGGTGLDVPDVESGVRRVAIKNLLEQ
jgi:hypothetical protein